jgi:hypothetical protein
MFFVASARVTCSSKTQFLSGLTSFAITFSSVPFSASNRVTASFDSASTVTMRTSQSAELGAAIRVAFLLVAFTFTLPFVQDTSSQMI